MQNIFYIEKDKKNLNKLIKNLKFKKKIISLAHGVFDVIHLGHLEHLSQAKSTCDVLFVSITVDKYVRKGPGRPYFKAIQRAHMLLGLACVDYVIINNKPTAVDLLNTVKPNFYVKGPDYRNKNNDITKNIYKEEKILKKNYGKIYFTTGDTFSSSNIINLTTEVFSEQLKKIINEVKNKFNFENFVKKINKIKNKKILIIGETIIDQYNYVKYLDKAGKEDLIATSYLNKKTFYGGALASLKHLSEFSDKIDLITLVGKDFNKSKFFSLAKLNKKKIKIHDIIDEKFNTILKERYINEVNLKKIFEVYKFNSHDISLKNRKKLNKLIKNKIKQYDLVIVADYGHGFIDESTIKLLNGAKFLSVNTQTNAGNRGFNLINKYKKTNYCCVDLPEAKLATSINSDNHEILFKKLTKTVKTDFFTISLGKKGCALVGKNNKITEVPAFNERPIDTMGAGDAFLLISSILFYLGYDTKTTGLISNLYASIKIKIVGHEEVIKKNEFLKSLMYILK